MIKRILLGSVFVLLFSTPGLAQDSPILDKQSRKIIIDRICQLRSSNRYTSREIFNLTRSFVFDNASLTSLPQVTSDDEILASIQQNSREIINTTNSMIVTKEVKSLFFVANRRCP